MFIYISINATAATHIRVFRFQHKSDISVHIDTEGFKNKKIKCLQWDLNSQQQHWIRILTALPTQEELNE